MPEGPNIEADPGAAEAAQGRVPLKGPRAGKGPADDAPGSRRTPG